MSQLNQDKKYPPKKYGSSNVYHYINNFEIHKFNIMTDKISTLRKLIVYRDIK